MTKGKDAITYEKTSETSSQYVTVNVRRDIHAKLGKLAGNMKITGLANEVLENYVNQQTGNPFLKRTVYSAPDKTMLIKDLKKDAYYEVTVENGSLYCKQDKVKSCIHIGYAMAQPELALMLDGNEKEES